jgi:hypothetical protein
MSRWWKQKKVFTSKLTTLIVLLASSFSQNTNADQSGCAVKMREAIQALNADTQGMLISDEERSEIEKIFRDPEKRLFAAGYVFDLLMEKRLALLPSQDADKIREIIQKAKVKPSSRLRKWLILSPRLTGSYELKSQSVTILRPESYRGSIVEFFMKTHEIEHAIQGLVVAKAIGKSSLNYFERLLTLFDSKLLFIEEAGAMQAEWQYLQTIPLEIKRSISEEIRKNPRISKSDRAVISRILLSDEETADQHLQIQRKAGRYTLADAQRASHKEIRTKLGVMGVSIVTPFVAVARLESYCHKLLDQSIMLPDSQFYQKVCSRFQSVQKQQAAKFPTP